MQQYLTPYFSSLFWHISAPQPLALPKYDEIQLFRNGKQLRFLYLLHALAREAIPRQLVMRLAGRRLSHASELPEYGEILRRVAYYNKLPGHAALSNEAPRLSAHKRGKRGEVYYFDTEEYLRGFRGDLRWMHIPGDVTTIPEFPTIVKSRPVGGDNANSVLLNLNKIRHFVFVKDETIWDNKEGRAVFRGKIYKKEKRLAFFERYFGNPLCDLGDTSHHEGVPKEWFANKMTISEQLKYKFILSIEGNDVASNLKWIMSSNSIAVMPKPQYETWFMEGTLVPNVHYIEIKPDYSDLEEKLAYYSENPAAAHEIIRAAHRYVERFQNPVVEDTASLMVLRKYFDVTNG